MGPDHNKSNLPTRPKYSWNPKDPPWTDAKGDQEEYYNAVRLWSAYHDGLADENSNKVPTNLRAIDLKANLYGRARDLCSGISDAQLVADNGLALIVGVVYKRDALSVVREAYKGFTALWNAKRNAGESMRNFESRFTAQVAKFNSIAATTRLPECITALMLLANSSIDDNQRVSVLAAAAPTEAGLGAQATNDQYLAAVTYNSLVSVVNQCDVSSNKSLVASSAGKGNYYSTKRTPMSEERYSQMVMKFPCRKCGKFGHWAREHARDGSLPNNVKSLDKPETGSANENENMGSYGKKKTLNFSMAKLQQSELVAMSASNNQESMPYELGPLLDDGAPYSALGEAELALLVNDVEARGQNLNPIPSSLSGYTHWQYGAGEHASEPRKILGSVNLDAKCDDGRVISITHLVLEGSSQWVVGKNVTRKADILHANTNALSFEEDSKLSLLDHELLSYIPRKSFLLNDNVKSLCAKNARPVDSLSWKEQKALVDKVHHHVCGHAEFSDFETLLTRNGLWSERIRDYLKQFIVQCRACGATSRPQPSRKVAIASLSKEFNEVVTVDHFYLDGICVFHCMDYVTRFSAVQIVESTKLKEAVAGMEACWFSHFWYPSNIQGDAAFNVGEFKSMMENLNIPFRPVAKGRHSKNPIESKHGVIRNIFVRLKEAAGENINLEKIVYQAVSISNDLYGNDVMSSYELAKGFTKPLFKSPHELQVPDDVINAHENIKARRKLALILKSNSTKEIPINVGDNVEIYRKAEHAKTGSWSNSKVVLKIDPLARTIYVPGKNGKELCVAIEDVRKPFDDELSKLVQEALDELENAVDFPTMKNIEDINDDASDVSNKQNSVEENIDIINNEFLATTNEEVPNVKLGDRISVYWPEERKFFPGTVRKSQENGKRKIVYDDGDEEILNLNDETWKFIQTGSESGNVDAIEASSVKIGNENEVDSIEQKVLSEMLDHFGNKVFFKHQSQGFEQFPLMKSYEKEQDVFLVNVTILPKEKVPNDANIIRSHVLYKVKTEDSGKLKLKARIAPHGNEDVLKDELTSTCASCSPTGIRILQSVAAMFGSRLYKGDVKAAHLQTGPADREVYVVPPRESKMRADCLWLLNVAAYGLVNAGSKWQDQADRRCFEFGLVQSKTIPQLFFKKNEKGEIVLMVAKVVEDLLAVGPGKNAEEFLEMFHQKFELGTVCQGPGEFRFFGMNVSQSDDWSVTTDVVDKLDALSEYSITRHRRKESESEMNEIEKKHYASINSSLGWIGNVASPLCSFYANYLQQKAPGLLVKHVVEQNRILKNIKNWGSTITYSRPELNVDSTITVLVFADASKSDEYGQLGVLCGFLIGDLQADATFHLISWTSHKAKRPCKSVPEAEILAAGEGIDDGKVILSVLKEILDVDVKFRILVDSKDLFTSMSTQRNSIDKSIRSDVGAIRYAFETQVVNQISWIPGSVNLADVLTKRDSVLTDSLLLSMFTGKIKLDISKKIEETSSEKKLG